jgi:hypothetical protein
MAFGRHPEPEFREVTFQPHQARLQEAITTAAFKGSNHQQCVLAQRMMTLAHTAGENQGKRLEITIDNNYPLQQPKNHLRQWRLIHR